MPKTPHELIPLGESQHPVTRFPKSATELPFFYLTKQKELLAKDIHLEGQDNSGKPSLWKVKPNRSVGIPGIDAHEVMVRYLQPILDSHRDSEGRLPQFVPLTKIREALRIIGWGEGGFEARRFLNALNAIGSAWIESDQMVESRKRAASGQKLFVPLKGKGTRFSIFQVGETHLTEHELHDPNFDFSKFKFNLEDNVYISLQPMEVKLQGLQPSRFTDNQFQFSFKPAARRTYELIAPLAYGVVKNRSKEQAGSLYFDLIYSEYIKKHHTQRRHTQKWAARQQMKGNLQPFIASRYLLKFTFHRRPLKPGEIPDFFARCYVGEEAWESTKRILTALKKQSLPKSREKTGQPPAEPASEKDIAPKQPSPQQPGKVKDEPYLVQLTTRGITKKVAREILTNIPERERPLIIDRCEWWDSQYATRPAEEVPNPQGVLVAMLRGSWAIPAGIDTSRKRKLRQEAAAAERQQGKELAQLHQAYDRYQQGEIDAFINQNHEPPAWEQLIQEKMKPLSKTLRVSLDHPELRNMAQGALRGEIADLITFKPFAEFADEYRKQPRLFTQDNPTTPEEGSVGGEKATHTPEPSVAIPTEEGTDTEDIADQTDGQGIDQHDFSGLASEEPKPPRQQKNPKTESKPLDSANRPEIADELL